ncbi:MAG: poly-gamma-glutamate synthase PgsB [Candidatus Eisenbacteria bacterium]|nr:poly-gamma-glutamate synthase PgsB [Candidatus Eisenbacteria bacterium]
MGHMPSRHEAGSHAHLARGGRTHAPGRRMGVHMVGIAILWIRDLFPYPLFLVLFAAVVGLYLIERVRHRRALGQIPLRIHINGTRGKSSVTRLIAAGLRAGGIRTVAKTTGSAPRYIHPDGSEEPILRRGRANIREQIPTLVRAAAERAEALVVECMAIRPDLQRVTEKKMIHATHGVITNIRADHLDVMGPRLDNVATALATTTPRSGKLFACHSRFDDYLRSEARRRNSELFVTMPDNYPTLEEMRGFDHIEVPDNVALALDVCANLGVDRATALHGMHGVTPDVGAAIRIPLTREQKQIEFINAFAANDQESTALVWKLIGMHQREGHEAGVLISNRGDRLRRAVDIADAISEDIHADWYVVAGDHAGTFIRLATRKGVPREKLIAMGDASPPAVLAKLFELTQRGATVMGVGNMGGFGIEFIKLLEKERSAHAS